MPVQFALRPRIRLREAPAPARRARVRLPRFALPALAYWLAVGGLVYEFVQHHAQSEPPSETEATQASLSVPPAPITRQWWRRLPAHPSREPLSETQAQAPAATATPSASFESELPSSPTEPRPDELPSARAPVAELSRPAPREESESPFDVSRRRASERALTRGPERTPPTTPTSPLQQSSNNVGVPAAPLELAPFAEPDLPRTSAPSPVPSPPAETSRPAVSGGIPSCESAIASASQDMDFSGGNRAADLPTQAIAAVLENGSWLSSCNVPEHTALDVCVAIKGGHVVGASVTSRPADAALNQCLKRRAASLQFPYSPHLDVARTRF